MTTIEEVKKAISEMEKIAHKWEQAREADPWEDADFYEKVAGLYRIAAAACWEKLERLEAGDGWARPEKGELPAGCRNGDCHCKRITRGWGHPYRKLSDRQLLCKQSCRLGD